MAGSSGSFENSMAYESTYRTRELRDYNKKDLNRRGPIDLPFMVLTIVILTIGVIMVLSASYARAYYTSGDPTKYFVRQAFFAVSGIGIMLVMAGFNVNLLRRLAFPLLVTSVVMLALVPIIGVEEGGARRWLNLGFTTFQPSELAKPAVVLVFSSMICTYKDKMKTFKYGVLPFGIILAIIVGLLVLEPHLSASVIIIAVGAILMFAGGTQLRWFFAGGGVVAAAGYLAISVLGYASSRITSWLDPFSDPQGVGYQIIQSLYAIGSGGFLGTGLGQGRQKYLYLPEEHNDFIFSVVCEELGFVGATLIILLFALLIIRGFWLAFHARDKFGTLVITGLTSLLALQVFLNIAVVTNLIPCTGISLPFFSYGGTALWVQMAEMGIILAVSRDIPVTKPETKRDKE